MTASVVDGPGLDAAALSPEQVASADLGDVLRRLGSSADGLSSAEASARRSRFGPNSVRTHRVSAIAVLGRQLRNAVLWLLAGTAAVSFFLGDSTQAIIIGIILAASIGLGFVNEYRAERTAAALHSRIHHTTVVRRDGRFAQLDVNELVPGDVIQLTLGELVPADVRLIEVAGLECNESILSGESIAREKSPEPVASGQSLADLTDLAFMGTVVSAGESTAVVYATGVNAQFGRIAAGLGERQPETDFQVGLRRFSYLLLRVAIALTVLILITNLMLHRPIIDSVLFSLAIAVGITPQLLPAVVSMSLATGSRRLANLKVLVKRLVCIEDLGDIDVLVTDKTGTLTEGRITLIDALDAAGARDQAVLRAGLWATDVDPAAGIATANPLDAALWESSAVQRAAIRTAHRVALLPFDHLRRAVSALIDDGDRRRLIVKGAPEQVLAHCDNVSAEAHRTLAALFADGRRVVAVASKAAPELTTITADDESGLTLDGFLVFADEPKSAAQNSLAQLAKLGIEVKVATGDNPQVAEKVCADLGLVSKGTITGVQMDGFGSDDYAHAVADNTIFARISPSHWNIAFIRRFMLTFGPISSLFDFMTFGLLLGVLHAGAVEFRTGWFVESLATQTLIIFAIRTRRVPFMRSRPGILLTVSTLAVVAAGVLLTISPWAHHLGFTPFPWQFFAALIAMTIGYLVLVEITKTVFYIEPMRLVGQPHRTRAEPHRIHRRAARFSHGGRISSPAPGP